MEAYQTSVIIGDLPSFAPVIKLHLNMQLLIILYTYIAAWIFQNIIGDMLVVYQKENWIQFCNSNMHCLTIKAIHVT